MATRSIAAVIVALTLAACGGAAATTEADDTAVDEYATTVASHDGAWRESVADADFNCADSEEVDVCAAAYQTGSEAADALRTALSAAQEGGEVPVEIAALVADTEAAAAEYSAAYEAWEATDCANPLNSHCGADEAFAMFEAQGELTRQLDAWKPPTG
jgi:phage tail sheath protein FI